MPSIQVSNIWWPSIYICLIQRTFSNFDFFPFTTKIVANYEILQYIFLLNISFWYSKDIGLRLKKPRSHPTSCSKQERLKSVLGTIR